MAETMANNEWNGEKNGYIGLRIENTGTLTQAPLSVERVERLLDGPISIGKGLDH